MKSEPPPNIDDPFANPIGLVKWLEDQARDSQTSAAQEIFGKLLNKIYLPNGSSANTCAKLRGFVEQCSKSSSDLLREWAFSTDTSLNVFNFFIESGDNDLHRSMKLILDLLVSLLGRNPNSDTAEVVKVIILDTLLSVIRHKSTKPGKPSLKAWEHFTAKSLFTIEDIASSYKRVWPSVTWNHELTVWKDFLGNLFEWIAVHSVHTTTGKIIVNTYKALRQEAASGSQTTNDDLFTVEIWHQWLQEALSTNPDLLQEFKLYIFPSIFKDDCKGSLQFLEQTKRVGSITNQSEQDLDIPALLRIAALEVGKKIRMVAEPGELAEPGKSVVLEEDVLQSLLAHHSSEVRSLALSLLISCPSALQPFSAAGLQLLRSHLQAYFTNSDGKFRMETLSNLKTMFKRLKGAIFVLQKAMMRAETASSSILELAKGVEEPRISAPAKQAADSAVVLSWPATKLRETLEHHENFLKWYLKCLRKELMPTASYQQHITALRAILEILKLEGDSTKTWEMGNNEELFFDSFNQHWARVLLDLIMDPYDDVRDTSSVVLGILVSDSRFRNVMKDLGFLTEFISRAEDISRRTSRADHADGVARTHELLYRVQSSQESRLLLVSGLISRLENNILLAEQDLGQAVLEAPIHGFFASLRYVWQAMSGSTYQASEIDNLNVFQNRILRCCQRIWAAVKEVLCDDSPEGHLPQELEELEGLDTKDLLSYSFRAIHESSNLMRTMVLSINRKSSDGSLFRPANVFVAIGTLTFDQLSNLRHRGAFSTVSTTFATCCQSAKDVSDVKSDREVGDGLLSSWYDGTIDCIFAQASTTRRSAGIPAMVTGILSANSSQPSFDHVMKNLMQIAQTKARVPETGDIKLPQVHALNCLTEVFKSSFIKNLGKSERYLPQCLELAATSLQSEIWAIRNCGLLFLRSLIDSLFGTNGTKAEMEAGWDGKATRLQYNKYPILPSVLLNLLRSGHEVMASNTATVAAESVFPALDIIRRDGPPKKLRDELYSLVTEYTGSPVWHVRDMAARALCCFLLREDWVQIVEQRLLSFYAAEASSRANLLHGTLLTVKHVLQKLLNLKPDHLQRDISRLSDVLQSLESNAPDAFTFCADNRGVFVEITNILSSYWLLPNGTAEISDATVMRSARQQTQTASGLQQATSQTPRSALLRLQLAVWTVYDTARRSDVAGLEFGLTGLVNTSTDAAVAMLEAIPQIWRPGPVESEELCVMYINVCMQSAAPNLQAVGLENLAEVIDDLLKANHLERIPVETRLRELWAKLANQSMNPTLSNAIIRFSGSVMAAIVSRHGAGDPKKLLEDLPHWGIMMADAGLDDKTFDTRLAAAASLKSFFTALKDRAKNAAYLPSLFALYDTMNDDDDEIRDLGAAAARGVLGQFMTPIEAANHLLKWLGTTFGHLEEFRYLAVCRLVGYSSIPAVVTPGIFDWEPAESQLVAAMKFDDALFVIEERNMFIDEFREAERWTTLFASLPQLDEEPAVEYLESWAVEGLKALTKLAEEHDDMALGWASQPQVYAIVSRVTFGCSLLLKLGRCPEIKETLEKLRDV